MCFKLQMICSKACSNINFHSSLQQFAAFELMYTRLIICFFQSSRPQNRFDAAADAAKREDEDRVQQVEADSLICAAAAAT
jgi:hypothetical protein